MQVAVIFKHAGINNFRHTHAVEFVEIGTALERFGNLYRAVTAEIVENNAVAVVYSADRRAVFGNDKCWKRSTITLPVSAS